VLVYIQMSQPTTCFGLFSLGHILYVLIYLVLRHTMGMTFLKPNILYIYIYIHILKLLIYEGSNFISGNYLFTTDTK